VQHCFESSGIVIGQSAPRWMQSSVCERDPARGAQSYVETEEDKKPTQSTDAAHSQ
jgi:hypothetical protein